MTAQGISAYSDDDIAELLMVQQELAQVFADVITRLESLPSAEPMDSARSTLIHSVSRIDDLLRHHLGEHGHTDLIDFSHPEHRDQ